MGFLSKIGRMWEGGQKYNTMAKAMGRIIELLDKYERHQELEALYSAAWLCRVGVMDIIENYPFSPTATIRVFVYGRTEAMPLHAAYLQTCGRVITKAEDLPSDQRDFVTGILEKGPSFYSIDKKIPYENKKQFI